MSDEEYVRLEVDPPLATLTLCRPEKLNAWSWASARALTAQAETLRFDDRVRAVLLRAEGRAFCAGVSPRVRVHGILGDYFGEVGRRATPRCARPVRLGE